LYLGWVGVWGLWAAARHDEAGVAAAAEAETSVNAPFYPMAVLGLIPIGVALWLLSWSTVSGSGR
jgi:hypothetical protein